MTLKQAINVLDKELQDIGIGPSKRNKAIIEFVDQYQNQDVRFNKVWVIWKAKTLRALYAKPNLN